MAIMFIKDPAATLDYKFDWSRWLASDETIASFTVTVDVGLTKSSAASADSGKSVIVWLSGGTLNSRYNVVCQIVTTAARRDERTILVILIDR